MKESEVISMVDHFNKVWLTLRDGRRGILLDVDLIRKEHKLPFILVDLIEPERDVPEWQWRSRHEDIWPAQIVKWGK